MKRNAADEAGERTFTTREVAQMWNVSESTVKRWANSFGLKCFRTLGGHRRFRLKDLSEFQQRRSFEATGVLPAESWEYPDLEDLINRRSFDSLCELLLELARFNRRPSLRLALERLYLRGLRLEEIYDLLLAPMDRLVREAVESREIPAGQALLVLHNIEEALFYLAPKLTRRHGSDRLAVCASPTRRSRMQVSLMCWLLEIEGWEVLTLGDEVDLTDLSKTVETEPVNLACVFVGPGLEQVSPTGLSALQNVTKEFRIPVLLTLGNVQLPPSWQDVESFAILPDFRTLRKQITELSA